jgi:UDP:flavonoid glycosyltransferase YjiC (YdhE family)
VYVGTGTSGNRALLPKIVEAVAGLPSRVAVTTGGRDVALAAFDNVFAAPYLPGAEIARRAALVITNGGSPGTYQSLAEGTPVLAIPSNIDQHRTMAAIAWRGATVVVRSDQASVRSIRNAVRRMLEDDAVRAAARSVATDFKRYRAADLFPRFVESVVGPLS